MFCLHTRKYYLIIPQISSGSKNLLLFQKNYQSLPPHFPNRTIKNKDSGRLLFQKNYQTLLHHFPNRTIKKALRQVCSENGLEFHAVPLKILGLPVNLGVGAVLKSFSN